ncbi:hypothetical protein Q4E93_29045 [Flavitalea sp. BT771]|uniref:hypothetical protein n=1 Tax=Flavitalea sp. BT771 TaxID=3063329 RepID=UPI0026E1C69F|nr:hypothetical protein [Flavitalea sp. BT771]MDO6434693.1 hypothetical protein [Flavitalea sp. BT771]MDV6223593.1 hypothetical protein [Flavitalea sp. BT771]
MQRLIIIFCLVAAQRLCAQTATGSWYGRADVEMAGMHNNYLTELVIKQKGNRVDGIFGYYFRDKYQSFFVHGRYNPKTREVIILNIPIIYFNSNSTVNSIDCNTNFIGVIIRSKVGSTLKGSFYHDEKYKYLCPDLKVSYTLDRDDQQHDSLQEMTVSNGKMWKPQPDDFVVDAVKTDQKPPPSAPPAVTRQDTPLTARVEAPVQPTASIADPAKEESKLIAESYSKRKEIVTRTLEVESDSVRLSFYDNGDIDGDSISVFVNNQVILTHQELASRALTMYLHLDSTLDVNEVSMFAENLGKYPPNTALMVVTDGKNRYEVFMSSSLTENATIRIKRKKGH